ncbi:GLPGLI family protein [Salinimicrobium sp. 3283s]|uniref:GLPGLI family protein n=1 Tax=Salinimicrobium sp. 3283s TaxID=3114359 RepID=UPI0031F0C44F
MRKLLIAFFFLNLGNLQAQKSYSYKATYSLEYQEDSTDQSSIKSETVVLYLGKGHSRYSSLGKAVKDSLKAYIEASNISKSESFEILNQAPETEFHYKIFKNYQDNELILAEIITVDKWRYKYIQNLNTIDWKIQPENKDILGFSVQRATGSFAGRNYVAWFAPQLPFSDGPYKFSGLPGLILEISDLENHYHFSLTGFEELANPIDKLLDLNSYKVLSQEELDQFRDDHNRDPLAAYQNAGVRFGFRNKEDEAKTRKALYEKYKKHNNPIELQP